MGNYTRTHYHAHDRVWPRAQAPIGRYVGVELEVVHRRGYAHLLDILPDPPDEMMRPATETDGSLPAAQGVEIVFPAFRYSEAKKKASFFGQTLAVLEQENTGTDGNCGMHLNVNTTTWNADKAAAFCAVINYLRPTWLERIGGRPLNAYCYQSRWSFAQFKQNSRSAAGRRNANRIECRFPRATTSHDKFVSILNFLTLVERYVSRKTTMKFLKETLAQAGAWRDDDARVLTISRHFDEWLSGITTDGAQEVRRIMHNA